MIHFSEKEQLLIVLMILCQKSIHYIKVIFLINGLLLNKFDLAENRSTHKINSIQNT